MSPRSKLRAYLYGTVAPAVLGAVALATGGALAVSPCTGPGANANGQTKCFKAIAVTPPNAQALRTFDISFYNPVRDEYYLGDRSNFGIDVVINASTLNPTFQRTIVGFQGPRSASGAILPNGTGAVCNSTSGPDGVAAHGKWLYAGDGDSTLKVIDLTASAGSEIKATISTGGKTRLDEMALTADGKFLFAANNAEDPPFGTLFNANGDSTSNTMPSSPTTDCAVSHACILHVAIDPAIVPTGFGLSIEQPAWDPVTARFYTSVPIIANNPSGCNYGQLPGDITCNGGLLVTDPVHPHAVEGAFNGNTGVITLRNCAPNGATLGPGNNMMLGCTPGNTPSNTATLVINTVTKQQTLIGNITGSDEVWFDSGDSRYYLGASKAPPSIETAPNYRPPGCPGYTTNKTLCAVLGVINANNIPLEKIPQSSGSHSVAAASIPASDGGFNIFVPQVAPVATVGTGGDLMFASTPPQNVGVGICGGSNGCIAVYHHNPHTDLPVPPPHP